jgi:hypothetical protein
MKEADSKVAPNLPKNFSQLQSAAIKTMMSSRMFGRARMTRTLINPHQRTTRLLSGNIDTSTKRMLQEG